MCRIVFIGTNDVLEEIYFDEHRPGLYLESLSDIYLPVSNKFSKPNVYYVGTSRGCGCDFGINNHGQLKEDITEKIGVVLAEGILTVVRMVRIIFGTYKAWEAKQARKEQLRQAGYANYARDNEELIKIIEEHTTENKTVELYCCWSGGYAEPASGEKNVVDINKTDLRRFFDIAEGTVSVYIRG